MYKIGISGLVSGPSIVKELRELFVKEPQKPLISLIEEGTEAAKRDILLLNEPFPGTFNSFEMLGETLVINSDEKALEDFIGLIRPRLIITYGFNSKASVTASSLSEGVCCVCVQRAFTTMSGIRRERQEFTIPSSNPSVTLAAVSAALAAGWEGL